jgi:ELWxxDGT repeat protein
MGRFHTCAKLDNGNVKCWGDDEYGQMGNGNGHNDQNNPSQVSFANGIDPVRLHVGHWHTCITAQTNEIYCWGDGENGKLGDGSGQNNNWAGSSAKVNHFSSTNPVKAHGDITSWAVHPALPTGLALGSTNGTLYGAPTSSIAQTNFTIYANNSGGSSSFVLNLGVNAQAPGPFEYNPENNTWTNNTEVHLAPQFINQTTGNGSTWQVTNNYPTNLGSHLGIPGGHMSLIVGDTIYFSADDGSTGSELWAFSITNQTAWLVADINSGSSGSSAGSLMHLLVGDTIYFSAIDDGTTGSELWAHDTSNHSTWEVADLRSGSSGSSPGNDMHHLVGDTIYFSANDGSTGGELWAHDTSNHSTWQVADIDSGAGNTRPGYAMDLLVGDTLYFDADDGSNGRELWAHDTSNHSTWQVVEISSGFSGSIDSKMHLLVGDTIYFSATDGSTGVELWAHDTSNLSTWQVADLNSGWSGSAPGQYLELLVGNAIYFSANDGSTGIDLWAHDTSNHSTWQVADLNGSAYSSPGSTLQLLVGDTIYF